MAARILLGLSALVWLPYGIFCLLQPGYLEGAAGLVAVSPTGTGELRAMYGGLQAAIGVLCVLGFARPAWREPALATLGFLTAGLAAARIVGIALGSGTSAYTLGAVGFEVLTAAVALALLRAGRKPGESAA